MVSLKIKKLHHLAKLPKNAYKSDAGYDLASIEKTIVKKGERNMIATGIAVEIPEGYYGRIAPRSGLAFKYGINVFAGVIDAGYRGEIKVILFNSGNKDLEVDVGDRIAQLILTPCLITNVEEVKEELECSERSDKGFGSSSSS